MLFHRRTTLLGALVLLILGVLLARLVRLQTAEARTLADELSDYRTRDSVVAPKRGRIIDRHGVVLAHDRDTHELWIVAANRQRRGGKHEIVSLLAPLSFERLIALGRTDGPVRIAERILAAATLARDNALVAHLADHLPPPDGLGLDPHATDKNGRPAPAPPDDDRRRAARERVAQKILAAVLRRNPGTVEGLREAARVFEDMEYGLYHDLLQRQAAGGHPDFLAARPRLGRARHYPQGRTAAHIVGYLSELDAEEYARLRGRWLPGEDEPEPGVGYIRGGGRIVFSILPGGEDPLGIPTDEEEILRLRTRRVAGRRERLTGYLPESRVGRAGLEQHYNEWLRGRHVLQSWWYDRRRPDGPRERIIRGPEKPPRDGRDVVVSLDLALQRQVELILADAVREMARDPANDGLPLAASAVVMDPYTGRLHALASHPDFDPNRLRADFPAWNADPARPMRHHAVSEHHAPGSTVKPFVALSALENKAWLAEEFHECGGRIPLDPNYPRARPVQCFQRKAHGVIDITHGLMFSCNTMTVRLAHLVGARPLYETLARYGFGRRTGIDLAHEAPGLLPRAAYTGRRFGNGYLSHLGIGQNQIVATPLQLAVAFAALANADPVNGARLVRPHLAVPDADGFVPDGSLDQPRAEFAVDFDALRVVRDGLYMVVQGDGVDSGSGRSAAFVERPGDYGLEVAGKTGSAQVDNARAGVLTRKLSHAWFAAYAPVDRPRVVVVVMVEYGDLGGRTSGPLVKRILRAFFERTDPDLVVESGVG